MKMKHGIIGSFLISLSACLVTYGSASIGEYLSRSNSVSTNAPVIIDTPAENPVVKESLIAQGSFVRPAISVADDGTVYVSAEGPGMGSVWLYTLKNNKWSGGQVVTASAATAKRTYVCSQLGDITSFRYGNKEGGKLHGPGTYRNGKEEFHGYSTGAARLAMSKSGPILMSKNGIYKNLKTGVIGHYNAGQTGEKFDFAIEGDTWATCHNGYSKEPSAVSVNGKRQTWADYKAYPDQGYDLNYPTVLINSGVVWCAAVYGGQLRVQSVRKNGKLRWKANKLPSLGKATAQDRCPPRLTVLSGVVYAVYVKGGVIYKADIEKCLSGKSEPVRICIGSFPSVDKGVMAYVNGSGLQIRQL
jgi:hypothetical protein